MKSFLQTKDWADFQKSLGREVFEYNQGNISTRAIKHRLPFGRSYLYIPHGPELDLNAMTGGFKNPINNFVSWLQQLAQREKAIFIKAEPLADNIAQLLVIEGGFKKSKKEVQPARTAVIDLTKSEDELLSAMRHKTRYNIKVAERHGVKVSESSDSGVFWQLMKQTAVRDKFSAHPQDYYQKMLSGIHGGGMWTKLFIASQDDRPLAAAIVLFHNYTAYYLHGASDYRYRQLMASYKLHWEIIKSLKFKSLRHYDLWGIDARHWPGVTRFKLGWGGQVIEYPGSFDWPVSWLWYWGYKLARKIL